MSNYMVNNYQNNRGEKNPPLKKTLNFCKKTYNSLYDVEYFLNNFKQFFKYVKLYKLLK